jgi:tetraacyldisaccharide 4'-kinase
VIALRNLHYGRQRAVRRADVPVISIGNLTTGGTGKTPLVILMARRLLAQGRRPVILTRGYAAARSAPADEVLEFTAALPGVPVVVNADRVAGAAAAVARHTADCLLLDDGFQHRRLGRDLDIVLIDSLNPWGGGWLLPAGNLREPRRSLRRAGLILITRANQRSEYDLAKLELEIRTESPRTPLLRATVTAGGVQFNDGRGEDAAWLAGLTVFPICGIGNPQTFLQLAADSGARLVGGQSFPDHFCYRATDAAALHERAAAAGADLALTTRKDFVKLGPLWPGSSAHGKSAPLAFLEVEPHIADPNGVLDRLLAAIMPP